MSRGPGALTSAAFAALVAASLAISSVPAARGVRVIACAVIAVGLLRGSRDGRSRLKTLGWVMLTFGAAWASTSAGAPSWPAFALALFLGLLVRRSLAPWVESWSSPGLALLAAAGLAAIAAEAGARWDVTAGDGAFIRLDRALWTLVVAWISIAGLRAVGELLRRWIRRASVRTKLLVAFGIFAVTPAVLAFAYAALAGWIHEGSLRASVISRHLEATSGGRRLIERAVRDPAPSGAAGLAARIARERPVLEDRGLAAVAWERGPEGWVEAARAGAAAPESLFVPAAPPVADSAEVVRGLAYRVGRLWWVESAVWPGRVTGGDSLALQTFEPVDTTRMNALARMLGCDVILFTSPSISKGETTITIGGGSPAATRRVKRTGGAIQVSGQDPAVQALTDSTSIDSLQRAGALAIVGGGAYAGAKTLGDVRGPTNGGATPPCFVWTGSAWRSGTALLLVRSGPADAFRFSAMDLGPFAEIARIALIFFAVLFVTVEIVSLVVGSRVARFITRGAARLRAAAVSIGGGDFTTRVQVASEDEMGELAASFNRMAEGLEEGQRAVVEREQMRRELELARRIQSRLLPPGPPSLPRLDVAAANAMSQEVGGDYYDFVPLEDGRVGFCIADVAGKGVAAALLMSSVKTALVSSAAVETAPDRLTVRVNRLLEQSIEPGRFVTFFLASLDPATLRLDYVNAGHPAPILLRRAGGVERLEIGGILLGIDAGATFQSGALTLAPGDLLAMFTDGVTEAQGADGELFGDARIESVLRLAREGTAEEVLRALIAAVKEYEGARGPSDDLTAVVVKVYSE